MNLAFAQFLAALRADCRLGRYVPARQSGETAESIVLALTLALAKTAEGGADHPAIVLLGKIEESACL